MEKTFGLLGEKLGHSFSPLIHTYLGNYDYPLYEISSNDFDRFMTERNFDGINVTIPYKQAVIPYCTTLSDEAQVIGSVNTIIKDENGALHGHNTDYHGLCVLLEHGRIDPGDKKTLVLGDGGSARTVRVALKGLGAREVVTISRRGEDNYENISRHYNAEIIINTTPVGMYPNNGNTPLSLKGFEQLAGVVDLIYNPMRTKLLLEAEQVGVPSINGLSMLVAQAEMASRLFLGTPARPERIDKILNVIRGKVLNIVLIGMPSCGKSTVGASISKMTGRPLVDIDTSIIETAGRSIPEIFAEGGEEAFRLLETRILGEAAKKSGLVIATGGGVVTQPRNLDLLRQNSIIVWLKRELTELSTDGRPLSESVGVEKLARQRLPLYESWCDFSVEVSAEPEQIAIKILDNFNAYNA